MTITVGVHASAGSSDGNTATTGSVTTTSGSCIVVAAVCGSSDATISDSKGNTYTLIGSRLNTSSSPYQSRTALFRCENAIGGSGHTFTATATGDYPSVLALELIGTSVQLDLSNQNTDNATPYTSPSLTPSQAGCAVVSFFGPNTTYSTPVYTPGGSFVSYEAVVDAGLYYVGAIAAYVQTSAAEETASWTVFPTPGANDESANVHIASFKEASSSVTGTLSQTLGALQISSTATSPIVASMSASLAAATLAATGTENYGVSIVGTTLQPWVASDAWSPTTLSETLAGTRCIITLGGWWNSSGNNPGLLPTDSAGSFTAAANTTVPGSEEPTQVQIAYQAGATGAHTITPPVLSDSGDGVLTVITVQGIASSSALRASGITRDRHAPVTAPDPDSIQSITVSTSTSSAQVGDFAVAVMEMDPNSTSNSDIAALVPSGWTLAGQNQDATDCIGFLAIYKVVTIAGTQSVTFTWTDPNTFVADAAIAVFKSASATAEVDGTLTATLAAVTSSAAGSSTITATIAATLATASLASTGDAGTANAALTQVLGDVTAAGTATSPIHGAVIATLGELTSSSAGSSNIAGVVAQTLAGVVLTATGSSSITGQLAESLADAVLLSLATAPIVAVAGGTLDPATLVATGESDAAITGTLNASLASLTGSGTGTAPVTGIATPSLASLQGSSTGTSLIAATVAVALEAATLQATGGAPAVNGVVSATLGAATASSTATTAIAGQLTATLAGASLGSTGTLQVQGSLTANLAAATTTATGKVIGVGALTATLDGLALASAGTTTTITNGSLLGTLADATLASSAAAIVSGMLERTLGNVTGLGAATSEVEGQLSATLAGLTLSTTGESAITGSLEATLAAASLAADGMSTIAVIVNQVLAQLLCSAIGTAIDVPIPPPLIPLIGNRPDSFDDGVADRPHPEIPDGERPGSITVIAERP